MKSPFKSLYKCTFIERLIISIRYLCALCSFFDILSANITDIIRMIDFIDHGTKEETVTPGGEGASGGTPDLTADPALHWHCNKYNI